NKVSDYLFLTAVTSVIAPLSSIYGLDDLRTVEPLLATIISIFEIHLIVASRLIRLPSFPIIRNGPSLAIYLSTIMIFYLVAWYFLSGAAFNFNLNLSRVYDFREINSDLAN